MGSEAARHHGQAQEAPLTLAPPTTYAQWAELLDLFGARKRDGEVIPAMKAGTLDWQSGVATRFSQLLVDSANARLEEVQRRFAREREKSSGDERVLSRSLAALRSEYALVYDAFDLPALPEDFRKQYQQMIHERADEAQESLEESARSADRTGRLLSFVRKTPVNRF